MAEEHYLTCDRCLNQVKMEVSEGLFGEEIKKPKEWARVETFVLCPSCAKLAKTLTRRFIMGYSKKITGFEKFLTEREIANCTKSIGENQ